VPHVADVQNDYVSLYLFSVQLFLGHEIISCWKEMKLQQYSSIH
jgi:hypothetical protein